VARPTSDPARTPERPRPAKRAGADAERIAALETEVRGLRHQLAAREAALVELAERLRVLEDGQPEPEVPARGGRLRSARG
jgi:hypothetical protein